MSTWKRLFLDYLDLNNENETRYLAILQKEISLLEWTLMVEKDLTNYLLEGCTFEQKEQLCEIIAEERGFMLKPAYDTPEAFERDYNRIIGKCAPLKLKLQSKISECNKYMESRKGNTITDDYFNSMLIRLWRYMGSSKPIRAKEISVAEFTSLVKEYFNYLQEKKKEMEAIGRPQPQF